MKKIVLLITLVFIIPLSALALDEKERTSLYFDRKTAVVGINETFTTSFMSNPVTSNSVEITARVEYSITGILDKEIAQAQTNWEKGYWLIKNGQNFTILAKI
jgi:hypothetical protein